MRRNRSEEGKEGREIRKFGIIRIFLRTYFGTFPHFGDILSSFGGFGEKRKGGPISYQLGPTE